MIILIFLFNYTEAIYTYFSLLINIVRLLALPEVNYHSIWLSVYFFFPYRSFNSNQIFPHLLMSDQFYLLFCLFLSRECFKTYESNLYAVYYHIPPRHLGEPLAPCVLTLRFMLNEAYLIPT